MTNIKLIDELLLDLMRQRNLRPIDLESTGKGDSLTREAMARLRKYYFSKRRGPITLTWARYFDKHPTRPEFNLYG